MKRVNSVFVLALLVVLAVLPLSSAGAQSPTPTPYKWTPYPTKSPVVQSTPTPVYEGACPAQPFITPGVPMDSQWSELCGHCLNITPTVPVAQQTIDAMLTEAVSTLEAVLTALPGGTTTPGTPTPEGSPTVSPTPTATKAPEYFVVHSGKPDLVSEHIQGMWHGSVERAEGIAPQLLGAQLVGMVAHADGSCMSPPDWGGGVLWETGNTDTWASGTAAYPTTYIVGLYGHVWDNLLFDLQIRPLLSDAWPNRYAYKNAPGFQAPYFYRFSWRADVQGGDPSCTVAFRDLTYVYYGQNPGEPTPTPSPTPTVGANCAVPAYADDKVAELDGFALVDQTCYTIIPEIRQQIAFVENELVIPGFEICVSWYTFPRIAAMGVTVPLTVFTLLPAAFLLRKVWFL